jgi:hypothetical protein
MAQRTGGLKMKADYWLHGMLSRRAILGLASFAWLVMQTSPCMAQPATLPVSSLKGPIPLDASNPIWETVPYQTVVLNGNTDTSSSTPNLVQVKALTNGKELGILVSWRPNSASSGSFARQNENYTGSLEGNWFFSRGYNANDDQCPKGLCPEYPTNPRPCPKRNGLCPENSIVLAAVADSLGRFPSSGAVVLKRALKTPYTQDVQLSQGIQLPLSLSILSPRNDSFSIVAESSWLVVKMPQQ